MAEFKAQAKYVRGSAQKARIPADIVRGMNANEALMILEVMNKKAAADIYKVLHSAVANAVNNGGASSESLMISEILIDQAPKYKRMKAGSRGAPKFFAKHNCHITITVSDDVVVKEAVQKEETPKKAATSKKTTKKTSTKKKVAKKEKSEAKSSPKKTTTKKKTVAKKAKADK